MSVALLGAMTVGALIALEGFSSAVLFLGLSIFGKDGQPLAERRHTQYDELVGWVNIPHFAVPDMYGPGVFLRTNRRGFRGGREVDVAVPAEKHRVICSGDSYTLGYGVDDDHTWCELLASLDPRIEPVNMGQGGYGIDQAYLWYKRDGSVLNHDVHIFAFITDDFRRMDVTTSGGVGKPILTLDRGHLVVKNIPVPRRRWYFTPWVRRFALRVRTLKTEELLERAKGVIGSRGADPNSLISGRAWDVALKVFEALQQLNVAKKSTLVLVWLPAQWDYPSSASQAWRRVLAAEAKQRGWMYIDLLPELQQLSATQFEGMFFEDNHHLTAAGNAWVASMLYRRISALPPLSGK